MLQAQIEIVDEAGDTEESVTILGSGRVFLGMRPPGGYLHAEAATPDLAVITQDGARVSIQVRVANSLQRDNSFFAEGSFELAVAQNPVVAFILDARRYLKVKQIFVNGELIRGEGAIIHSTRASDFQRKLESMAIRGTAEVKAQLTRLREQGKIDEHGHILGPLPDDMKPGSTTDL